MMRLSFRKPLSMSLGLLALIESAYDKAKELSVFNRNLPAQGIVFFLISETISTVKAFQVFLTA